MLCDKIAEDSDGKRERVLSTRLENAFLFCSLGNRKLAKNFLSAEKYNLNRLGFLKKKKLFPWPECGERQYGKVGDGYFSSPVFLKILIKHWF